MVVLNVKRDGASLFLHQTQLQTTVEDALASLVAIHNGRLKISRICAEVEALADHGVESAPEVKGLLEDQIRELNLEDSEAQRCEPSGGSVASPDPLQKRCGMAPNQDMKEVLAKTCQKAKDIISADKVKANQTLVMKDILECLDILSGAVSIVYPMGLPRYDPIKAELENREELQVKVDFVGMKFRTN